MEVHESLVLSQQTMMWDTEYLLKEKQDKVVWKEVV